MEVDGGEVITGSGGSSFMPSTSASDKEDGVSDLVHINLSNLIQVSPTSASPCKWAGKDCVGHSISVTSAAGHLPSCLLFVSEKKLAAASW